MKNQLTDEYNRRSQLNQMDSVATYNQWEGEYVVETFITFPVREGDGTVYYDTETMSLMGYEEDEFIALISEIQG